MPSLDRIRATFVGCYLGDALGMPVETFSAQKIKSLHGRITKPFAPPADHRFHKKLSQGDWTDDTEFHHAVADAIVDAGGLNVDKQAEYHVRSMKNGVSGMGGTTRKAIENLEKGTHWSKSAPPVTAKSGKGNGVGMKIACVGLYASLDDEKFGEAVDFTMKLGRMTHGANIAVASGIAVLAGVSYCAKCPTPAEFDLEQFVFHCSSGAALVDAMPPDGQDDPDLADRIQKIIHVRNWSDQKIIDEMGGGSCFCYDSIPFSLAFLARNPTSFESLLDCVNAGGDTDSNGAMTGAMLGALNGMAAFPPDVLGELKPDLLDRTIKTADRFAGFLGVEA